MGVLDTAVVVLIVQRQVLDELMEVELFDDAEAEFVPE